MTDLSGYARKLAPPGGLTIATKLPIPAPMAVPITPIH